MLNWIFSIFSLFVSSDFFTYFFNPILILAFIGVIPVVIRYFFRR